MITDLTALAVERGGLPVDDVLALALPLLEQVRSAHESGRVAPLRGLDGLDVADHRIGFDAAAATPPQLRRREVEQAQVPVSGALDVRRGEDRQHDLTGGPVEPGSAADGPDPASATGARFVAGWQRWEHLLGHHDELTDIGSLGELLTALCCGLDLADERDVAELARNHRNLFALVPTLHPVVAGVLTAMVEPDRHRRAQDLGDLTARLATYRDQPEDFDLGRVLAAGAAVQDRRAAVLTHLRERLFDLSRRNPLLHFRPTQRTLDLTEASVPLVLDVRSVRPAQLFTWGGPTSRRLAAGKPVDLGSVIRWDDAPYAFSALDGAISTARRDRAEFGRDQLRLVVAFLRWHDLKNDPQAVVSSPLVLAPAVVTKQRGVRDSYRIELASAEAEVNPVLRHQFRELYAITLPETVDLADDEAIETLRSSIERQAAASQPGVTVRLVDRPRIELIRSRAQTALQSYRRRRGGRRGWPTIGRRHYAYSYTRPGWVPLGIQIFREQVVRKPLPLSVELGDAPVPRQTVVAAPPPDGTVEQELFSLDHEGQTNPYAWEVDLCAVTLANFNYRTLSLVGDYDALLAQPFPNAGFDELFSTAPREPADRGVPSSVQDRFLVVPADGSQVAALAQARATDNFVIQGPPGTGKSQTITNLIADYVARGQRVLFVCQKRAALDVVHARLRSQGLDEICTLVHDSQQDKKSFVHGLRDTYQAWQDDDADLAAAEALRTDLVADLAAVQAELDAYDAALLEHPAGGRLVDLLDRLIALRDHRWGDDLSPAQRQLVPTPGSWQAARPAVDRLTSALGRLGGSSTLAGSPGRLLDPQVLAVPRAEALVAQRAEAAADRLREVDRRLALACAPSVLTLPQLAGLARLHAVLDPLARHGHLGVLKPRSAAATTLRREVAAQRDARAAVASTTSDAAGWVAPPAPAEARDALEVARRRESSLLRIFNGEWRRVRDLVADGYRGAGPDVPVSRALALLVARDDARAAADDGRRRAEDEWGHADLEHLEAELTWVRRVDGDLLGWRDLLAGAADEPREALDDLPGLLTELESALAGTFVVHDLPLPAVLDQLMVLAGPGGPELVRSLSPSLVELAALGTDEVLSALRVLDAPPEAIEYAALAVAVNERRTALAELDRTDGRRLQELLQRVQTVVPRLERANARVVTARLHDRFRATVELSQRSVSGMSPEDRATKKAWATGRRELEHEFGKVRAYRSIRQLASAESGAVVAAMRPVWLMSPSSLSDTLPLETTFDVVIFDEASQIPVEEAVPALHRARQVIVVGDRMQLPPTQYFQTRGPDDGAGTDAGEDDQARVGVVLDADSFLAVSSVRLPSTMLTWHYRSRYEALIQFSNAAFYEGRLATIPDRVPQPSDRPALSVRSEGAPADADVAALTDAVLERSISVVRVEDGVYDRRTNPAEAQWIAHLIRDLLRRETGHTLGVVAFSEAQQSEIERALEQLCRDDDDFETRYEAELRREDDGQTVGLFVKNLENVQGDERDVILMSVCYAPGPDGRMRMNFGPINNPGGEKRLNVIFSRSKQHMVLVSSIDHTAITNVYNDGANTLRTFLRYADAVSTGDEAGAAATLTGLRERTVRADGERAQAAILDQLATALAEAGLDVATDVGQSGFRCDLAVRWPDAPAYATAVLVDHPARLARSTADERRLTQPAALASAGWHVEQVPALEWWERPEEVVARIVASVPDPAP